MNKYVDYIVKYKNREFALNILENYTLVCIDDYNHGKNDGTFLAEIFANMACLTLSNDIKVLYMREILCTDCF